MVKIIKNALLNIYLRKRKNEFLKNVFNTKFQENVLLVYITSAFDRKLRYSHSNLWECKIAGEIFRDLGFNVDVINYNTHKLPDIKKYTIIYGMGETFEKLFSKKESNQLFINYATGCNPIWSNIETVKKLRTFYDKSNKLLPESSRLINHTQHLQILLSDKVIVLGNDFVKNTYLSFDDKSERYENLNAFYFDFHNISIKDKIFFECRKNFLWFGSAGALHKGLDLCLDYFAEHPELNLHICGLNVKSEKRFVEYYHKELFDLPNIYYHGFLKLDSEALKEILIKCGFVIFPSVSEGGAVALLNVIANGALLPIYSNSTGVPFENDGFEFNSISTESLEESILKTVNLDEAEFFQRSENLQKVVRNNFTIDEYKKQLKVIISNTLHDNKA